MVAGCGGKRRVPGGVGGDEKTVAAGGEVADKAEVEELDAAEFGLGAERSEEDLFKKGDLVRPVLLPRHVHPPGLRRAYG